MKSLLVAALLGCLIAVLVDGERVKWCVTSPAELAKCRSLEGSTKLTCVDRASIIDCLTAIKNSEADAITLDGGEIYTAGLDDYQLHPIIAEEYKSASETCYYAVAVAKKETNFVFKDLKGKKSCHTGLGKSAGWNIPIGTLLSRSYLSWNGSDSKSLETAVSEFFGGSCVPGAKNHPRLCELCNTDCSMTSTNRYYNYDGAFRCLKEKGDVAFIKHLTIPDGEKDQYELLCLDNTRAPIDNYKSCNLQRVPAHAVVTRKDKDLEDLIWNALDETQRQHLGVLFKTDHGKNLMFKDSTEKLVRLPPNTDAFTYLGVKYMRILQSLKRVNIPTSSPEGLRWCVLGEETSKCDDWNIKTMELTCVKGESPEHCLKLIMRSDADAATVDGGQVYTAGKCGLVPAMVEQYDAEKCSSARDSGSHYFAVAVIKRDSGITWDNLQNKKSCHTGIGRTAGWNIPMGRIHENTQSCDFKSFFSQSCAPGADVSSTLCSLCVGDTENQHKCKPTSEERYNGYTGALKCLADGVGDVAFTKYSVLIDNSNGMGLNLNLDDYQLICPGRAPVPIDKFSECHLAKVPAHAVVTRPEKRDDVVKFLKTEQGKYGTSDGNAEFQMFSSASYAAKNMLFKDRTQCLQEIPIGQNFEQFLGEEYMKVMKSLRKCEENTSELERSCTFHPCQNNI
ncbi:transferrin-a precursor [Cynoglossus semilaevis]|uniref:Serotransferrin n=1 Tax=Cynoglossus semilaevis TaxID=244447 RepID=L7NCQ9_CYNSE|nr:transferrin-a precursor [Cynoglossus semilaevis]AEI84587.1 TF [Cynoglossus semilaevis]